ncbi:hypothetical protein [Campylobacter concisus]|uniref:hypothetical protein n=1 Tax=Campylobacter concisus TaxID=199 RepID=UPI001CB7359C|nr:hypothetical protein [Campylobacter concisus]
MRTSLFLKLKKCVLTSNFCLSLYTGSALLVCAGVPDGLKATSNKRSLGSIKG